MNVHEYFEKELNYIKNDTLRCIVADTLDASPECIVHIPASSSGRYHPVYSLGDGGLMRHVKAAVGIAHCMIETDIFKNLMNDDIQRTKFPVEENVVYDDVVQIFSDAAYAAIILHDCRKPDDTEKHGTRFDHPILAAKLFKEIAAKYITKDNMEYMKKVIPMVHGCIASHMGSWNTAPYAKGVVLPKPQTSIEHFVHVCDYLASRKFLIFDFDVYNEVKR